MEALPFVHFIIILPEVTCTQFCLLFLIFYFTLTVADRGVQFVSGLSDTVAYVGERAELSCKLSSDTSEGRWYKNGKLVSQLFQEK